MTFLALAVALVSSDARLEGTASARLETRARTATGADAAAGATAPPAAASDAEVTPSLFGALDNLGGRLAIGYAPTLRARQWYADQRRTEVNHSQTFEARWTREGRPSPYLLQSFYFGRVDLAAQQTGGTAPVGAPAFQLGQVSQTALDLNGGVVWPIGKLMKLDTSVGFAYSSGVDAFAKTVLPTQQAYRTRGRLETQLTAVDLLTSQLDGLYASFPGELANFTTASASQRWRRQLLVSTALELGLLAGVFRSEYPVRDMDGNFDVSSQRRSGYAFAPGGDIALNHRINGGPHLLNFDGGIRVAPFVDRYMLAAFNRGEVYTAIAYTFRERWVFTGRGSVARSLTPVSIRGDDTNSEILTTSVEARAGYWAPRYWRLELSGLNSTYMIAGGTTNNWVVSLSLTLLAAGQL